MFLHKDIKKQLESLCSDPNNSKCFDCGKQPARWASLRNGIFLCFDCAEEHKSYEINVSYIKSITLEEWSKEHLNIMKTGGNNKLKLFLKEHGLPLGLDKRALYHSKLMNYYRSQLKSESERKIFMDPLPSKEEYWNHFNQDDDLLVLIDNKNIILNNPLEEKHINKLNNESNEDNINKRQGHLIDLPKSQIIIDQEQYNIARQNSRNKNVPKPLNSKDNPNFDDKELSNYTLKEDGQESSSGDFSSNQKKSILNEIYHSSGYFETLGNMASTIFGAGIFVASSVKGSLASLPMTQTLSSVGGKIYSGVSYFGEKIYEKTTGQQITNNTEAYITMSDSDILNINKRIEEESNGAKVVENNLNAQNMNDYYY